MKSASEVRQLLQYSLGNDPQLASYARMQLIRAYREVLPQDLYSFTAELRHRDYWTDNGVWEGLKPSVSRFSPTTDDECVYLGLLSCHRNGFVREACVRLLDKAESGAAIPFMLLRTADVVPQVRKVAVDALGRRLQPAYAPDFVQSLPLLQQLKLTRRFELEVASKVEEFLRRMESRLALGVGLESLNVFLRRRAYALAVGNPGFDAFELLSRAITDSDGSIRRWAIHYAESAPDRFHLFLSLAATDALVSIRRIAFEWTTEKAEISQGELDRFLLDSSAGIRGDAQRIATKRLSLDLPAFYRTTIAEPLSGKRYAAILGLGEVGTATDAALVAGHLENGTSRMQRAVIRSVSALDAGSHTDLLLSVVARGKAPVVRQACTVLMRKRLCSAQTAWTAVRKNSNARAKIAVLRSVAIASKWQQILILLDGVKDEDEAISAQAIAFVRRWIALFNTSFAQPTTEDVHQLRATVVTAKGRLPRALSVELTSIIDSI